MPYAADPVWQDSEHGVWLYQGNCLSIMDLIAERYPDGAFDMIFADPPYFLSNGSITCHAGRMVSVNKGEWDKSRGPEENHNFNREWLARCQKVLKPDGTIWVSGTAHIIHSVGFAMQHLGFKLLNDITRSKVPLDRHRREGYVIPVPDERSHALPESARLNCPSFAQHELRQFDERRHGEMMPILPRGVPATRLLRPVSRHRQSVYSDCVAASSRRRRTAQLVG